MADNRLRKAQKGLNARQEIQPDYIHRDTRTLGMKFADFMSEPLHIAVVLGVLAAATLIYPFFIELSLLVGYLLYRHAVKKHKTMRLPIRLPATSGLIDYGDLSPGTKKPNRGRGIFFLGNEANTGREIWATNEDMRTHVLVMGTTGAGKTATLSSMTFNALVEGSGYVYVDGKADNALWARLYSMARMMGRDDDLLLISFMTGAKDIIGKQEKLMSNTMNPFTFGSSSMISQSLVSLLDDGGSSSDMWKGRAIGFIEALSRALVHMRDYYNQPLNVDVFREFFELKKLEEFTWNARHEFKMPKDEWIAFKPLENYLINVPGYSKDKMGNQAQDTNMQHGYITMQLTRTTGSLADTYGHVVNALYGEVDFYDVVINRRMLMVALPALEKAPDELANLGKIVISNLKATLASTLGADMEGDTRQIVENRPTNSKTPFLCVLDEYGYYAVQGFAVVAAQARSLGFSVVFAGQDYPAFKKAGEEEAASIIGNCNIKMCMKLEDPKETWDLFKQTAGEAYTTHTSGYSVNQTSVSNTYMDMNNSSVERRDRIELSDLKEQIESEAHIFFKSSIVRGDTFFADCPTARQVRLNSFVAIAFPQPHEVQEHLNDPEAQLMEINAVLSVLTRKPKKPVSYHKAWDEVDRHMVEFSRKIPRNVSDSAIYEAALLADAFNGKAVKTQAEDEGRGEEAAEDTPLRDPVLEAARRSRMSQYMNLDDQPDKLEPVYILDDVLDNNEAVESLAKIDELTTPTGEEDYDAIQEKAGAVVRDMGNGAVYTNYPPTRKRSDTESIVSAAINALSDYIDGEGAIGDN